jgi:hypothetical protein
MLHTIHPQIGQSWIDRVLAVLDCTYGRGGRI